MRRMLILGSLFVVLCAAMPARAGGFFGFFSAPDPQCYWCIRDAIYADIKLIDHLEANPDVDDAVKGPQIVAARADIHRLQAPARAAAARGTGAVLLFTATALYPLTNSRPA